jgi:hypothetical protein
MTGRGASTGYGSRPSAPACRWRSPLRCSCRLSARSPSVNPGLKLILDHMAVPPGSRGESAYRFQPELLAFAKYSNVAVKATGQPGYAEDAYSFRRLP